MPRTSITRHSAVYKVLVAGPGDVIRERKAVTEAINTWTRRHGDQTGVIMQAVSSEQARPDMSADPQAVINRQLGENRDAVIAVFGKRIGTATPRAISGTVEEIEEAIGEGKDVMVYFSSGPISRDGLDLVQLAKLEEFRRSLQSRGLLGSYKSLPHLKTQLDDHITRLGYEVQQRTSPELDRDQANEALERRQPETRSEDQAILKILSGDNHAGPWIYKLTPDNLRAEVKYQVQNIGRAPARDIRALVRIGQNDPVEIQGPPILSSLATANREGFVLPLPRPFPTYPGGPIPEDYPDSDVISITLFYTDFRHDLGEHQTEPFCFRFARVAEGAKWLSQRVDPCPGEPAPELSAVLQSSPAIRFGGAPATSPLNSADQEVFLAAVRHALQSDEPLIAATLIATSRLEADSAIAKLDLQDVRRSLDALKRRELINILLDQGSAGVQFQITSAGLDYALPRLVPNFNEQVERIRHVICDLKQTTSEELAHTGLARLLIEHVALDFKRQGLLKIRSYAEGTMHIEDPSPELCPSLSF
jgi:hypothetical protein